MEVIFHVYVWLSPFAVHQKLSWHCLLIGYVLACVLSRFNCVWLCATTWTAACQAPLSMGFSREDYWSRLPCPPPGDLSHPGTRTIGYTPIQNKVKKKKKGIFFSCRVSCILNFSDANSVLLFSIFLLPWISYKSNVRFRGSICFGFCFLPGTPHRWCCTFPSGHLRTRCLLWC